MNIMFYIYIYIYIYEITRQSLFQPLVKSSCDLRRMCVLFDVQTRDGPLLFSKEPVTLACSQG